MDNTLFVGVGSNTGGINHYRTIVPANTLGASWMIQDVDGSIKFKNILMDKGEQPHLAIFQMPVFEWHLKQMMKAKELGARVFSNVDDYLPSLEKAHKRGHHAHGDVFNKDIINAHHKCLEQSDIILCSTDWIADKYSKFGEVRLFKNGLDYPRYDVGKPERDMGFIVGWSGGTGHVGAVGSVAGEIRDFMWDNPDAIFVSMGDDMTKLVNNDGSLDGRVYVIKWNELHLYPRDMSIFDVNLAPSLENDFFRGKSQLRLYESAALGIPIIGSTLYDEIEHGHTGFIATKPGDYRKYLQELYDNWQLREDMSQHLKEKFFSSWSSDARKEEWEHALR